MAVFLLLIIGIRRGSDKRERKVIALAVIVGLASSVILWLGWAGLAALFTGTLRASLTLLVSAMIALHCVPLLLITVRHYRQPPQSRMQVTHSWLFLLFCLSAGVIGRDALEIVPAIRIVSASSSMAIIGFLGAGLALAAVVGLCFAAVPRLAINSRTALLTMSTTAVAIISAGAAARAAQDLELLGVHSAGALQSPWMSVWPTGEGVIIQLFFAVTCSLILVGATLLVESTFE